MKNTDRIETYEVCQFELHLMSYSDLDLQRVTVSHADLYDVMLSLSLFSITTVDTRTVRDIQQME